LGALVLSDYTSAQSEKSLIQTQLPYGLGIFIFHTYIIRNIRDLVVKIPKHWYRLPEAVVVARLELVGFAD
jgi:hypothetical protein